jgi:hypothetical protein
MKPAESMAKYGVKVADLEACVKATQTGISV